MRTDPLGPARGLDLFRLAALALLVAQMFAYYDTAPRTIPAINLYLLANLGLILLALVPWRPAAHALWLLAWPAGALLRWDWATRPTNSDVFWATSQGVDFLLRGLNPYTQTYTWVYEHQPGISNYPSYSYFPGGLYAEIPFFLLGNVRIGLALADLGIALLVYLLARPRLGEWPGRALAFFWLLFLPGFQIPLLLGVLDFLLMFWIALAVWLYSRGGLVGSALAAAMAFSTKQYGFLFAVPWGVLLSKPALTYLAGKWRAEPSRLRLFSTLPRSLWVPPAAGVTLAVVAVVPIALLSPRAFLDAAILHHTRKLPAPMLGTPQWNESIVAQVVAVGWLSVEDAARLAAVAFPALLVILLALAALKIRDPASALLWSAVISGVAFAASGGSVQFFYWRLVLLLFALYFIISGPSGEREPRADADKPDAI
jgi:hypothetical protein